MKNMMFVTMTEGVSKDTTNSLKIYIYFIIYSTSAALMHFIHNFGFGHSFLFWSE